MITCPDCGLEQPDYSDHCSRCNKHFEQPEVDRHEEKQEDKEESEAGTLGLGIDPTCGSIEPTIKLGGGIGLGMDGHITFGGF